MVVDTSGDYQVISRPEGYGVIQHRHSGESMHSVNNPSDEAKRLYVAQSGVLERASRGESCIVWDVGLGAATNAMELIRALEALSGRKHSTRLISFENDVTPLRLALSHPSLFAHAHHEAPSSLLTNHAWRNRDETIEWHLLQGDFLERLNDAPRPDIIWHDPFSYKVNTELWSVSTFKKMLAATNNQPARLFTYSASTAVRASMLCAGWYVGRGLGSGPKSETTIAFTPSAALSTDAPQLLLGQDWLSRWERSDAKQPLGEHPQGYESVIREHPQFHLAERNPRQ